MVQPKIPVSLGELVDKITILEIKTCKIHDARALNNIWRELRLLNEVNAEYKGIDKKISMLREKLKEINESLWNIEDMIRIKDMKNEFDEEFIELAKSVYRKNDIRSKIKREINTHSGSTLFEEKSYSEHLSK